MHTRRSDDRLISSLDDASTPSRPCDEPVLDALVAWRSEVREKIMEKLLDS